MEFERNTDVELESSDYNSRLQDKIGVVQQVLTLLENTMSSAKSTHQRNQASYLTTLDELELSIQNLRQEMQRDKDDFNEISDSLGKNIQTYLNLENQLLTIEERSHDDYVQLPKLTTSTDIYVAQYLPDEYIDWQRLKLQCEFLNQTTQDDFRENICVTRYQVSVESDSERVQRFMQTAEKANALNLIRGKKFVCPSPSSQQHRFVTVTWYRNEIAAKYYVQRNYCKIIEQIFKEQYDEYKDRSIRVTEVGNSQEMEAPSITELTIHVQAKTSCAAHNSMPRRIILHKFDETTTSIPTAENPLSTETTHCSGAANSEVITSLSRTASTFEDHECASNESRRKNKRSRSKSKKSSGKLYSQSVDDVLSFVGLDNDTKRNTESMNTTVLPEICSNKQQQNSSIAEVSNSGSIVPFLDLLPDELSMMTFDGVKMSESAVNYIQEKSIEKLTDAQKQVILAFTIPGDILFETVPCGGEITAVTISLINCIDLSKDFVQALIITANSRSSKHIQKEIELIRTIRCQRLEQLLAAEESNQSNESRIDTLKTTNRPSCHILVGTLLQMKSFVFKNLFLKDSIRFLILNNAEEIYDSVTSSQKQNFALLINKIIYTLDATVKVVVIRQRSTKCPELDAFCDLKLRKKQFIKDTVEESETERTRHGSDGKKSSTESDPDFRSRRISDSTDSSQLSKVCLTMLKPNEIDSDSASGLSTTRESDRNLEKCEIRKWRTLVSEHATQLLGISKNVEDKAAKKSEDLDVNITHLFANIEKGDESSKIDMLSMLNLEEDKAIIFCDSVDKAEWISTRLRQKELLPQVLHENVLPKDQKVILQCYRQGNLCRVLVCTDFASTVSLDSADVVLNFDLPNSNSAYINRAAFALRHIKKAKNSSGNAKGVVVNLILNDYTKLTEFEKSLGITIHNCED